MTGPGMIGRPYLDPGDRLAGKFDPPRACHVITRYRPGARPRNVAVEYADGSRAVIPFTRRLRRARPADLDRKDSP